MKVINLDRFRTTQTVSLEGIEYEVYGMTVRQFLENGGEQHEFENAQDQFNFFIDKLEKSTNIPRDVLVDQEPGVLAALFKVCQGIDPEIEEGAPEGSPEKK